MGGSIQIAKLFGIPLKVHWSFSLILIFVFYNSLGSDGDFEYSQLLWQMGAIVILFTCVVLHELGHALTARIYGVDTQSILLLPIGGLAMLTRIPKKPMQEFFVAIAGPLVNVAIVILTLPFLLFIDASRRASLFGYILNSGGNDFLYNISIFETIIIGLIGLNLLLALFNLIPAFPMDGGRILRALLATRFDRKKATRIASGVGQACAVILVVWGMGVFNISTGEIGIGVAESSWTMILIGMFVYITARNEYRSMKNLEGLENLLVKDIYSSDFEKLYLNNRLEDAFQLFKTGKANHFLIFDDWNNLKGTLSGPQLIKLAKENLLNEAIANHLEESYEYVSTQHELTEVLALMQQKQYYILPVVDGNTIIGAIDINQIIDIIKRNQS